MYLLDWSDHLLCIMLTGSNQKSADTVYTYTRLQPGEVQCYDGLSYNALISPLLAQQPAVPA